MTRPVLEVDGLRVELPGSGEDIVSGVSFQIASGEVLGLVGESGSGKTTIATALLGYARGGARITQGRVAVDGVDLLALRRDKLRECRGKVVAYVPQDPSAALNPALRIGTQLRELPEVHGLPTGETPLERIELVLEEVKLPSDRGFLRRFPHQLSGGQQQRICIAMAFLLRARLIVLDEPTTGLDVTTQALVLETIRALCVAHGVAALYVTHDLAVVANLADRVLVMYAGRLAEVGSSEQVFRRPAHPYSSRLIAAIPHVGQRRVLDAIPGQAPAPGTRPAGCFFEPRCPIRIDRCSSQEPPLVEVDTGHVARCHRAEVTNSARRPPMPMDAAPDADQRTAILSVADVSASYGQQAVLHDVSLELRSRECLALVGESGCGKTTLARSIIGLMRTYTGEIRFRGQTLARAARDRPSDQRRAIQYIFQSPYNSLNPRKTIYQIVETPLRHFFGLAGSGAGERVEATLARVALPREVLTLYPDQLSGGERQRVAIARALICEPEILICDEITSALDVSVQAAIIHLLTQLRGSEQLSLLFVTHNLALVRAIADRVIVMQRGRILESGETGRVLDAPKEPYTRELLADTPQQPFTV
jgi:peptide/nickel transport system ATP-binding protein